MLGLVGAGVAHAQNQIGGNVDVPSGINHYDYDRLLKKYVNEQGLVSYGAWKQSAADVSALDDYLKQFALKPDTPAQGNEKAAALVNAYNAFMLHWILSNYPTESVWQLKDSFSGKRNEIGGHKVSLDDIEHEALRPLIGYRAHSVLVCAARSCPPLKRFAYTGRQIRRAGRPRVSRLARARGPEQVFAERKKGGNLRRLQMVRRGFRQGRRGARNSRPLRTAISA